MGYQDKNKRLNFIATIVTSLNELGILVKLEKMIIKMRDKNKDAKASKL